MGDDGSPRTDADIVATSWHEPQEFATLFDRHARSVHRYVASRAGPGDIEDLVSETFVVAFRARHRYDPAYESARPWLLGIATNVVRQHRRSETRRLARLGTMGRAPDHDLDPAQSISEALDNAAEADRVRRALDRLDDRYRDVLLLAAAADLSYDEIARALGVPIGTVRSRLARGRRRLRELLGPDGQYEGGARHATPYTEGTLG